MNESNDALPQPPTKYVSDALGHQLVEQTVVLPGETLNDQEVVLQGVVEAAQGIAERYPQVDENGDLNYYFAGSMAAMLLAQTDHIDVLDAQRLPQIIPTETIPVSAAARQTLAGLTRKVGDVDIAALPSYMKKADEAVPHYDPDNPDAYEQAAKDWIINGIASVNFSENAQTAVKSTRADVATGEDAVRIAVDGQEFYIPDPKTMLEYKAIHLVMDFDVYPDKGKVTKDFAVLAEGLRMIYPRGELVRTVHDALMSSPNIVIPTYDKRVADSRAFFADVIAADENAAYAAQLTTPPERAMGMLNILRPYKTPEAKQELVNFINSHQGQLNTWQVNANDPHNKQAVAAHIHRHPESYPKVPEAAKATSTAAEEWAGANMWAVYEYASDLPAETGVVLQPLRNNYLDILKSLNEADLSRELAVLDRVMATPPQHDQLPPGTEVKAIFQSAVAEDPAARQALFTGMETAFDRLGPAEAQRFLRALGRASRNVPVLLPEGRTTEEQFSPVADCFREFGVAFDPTAHGGKTTEPVPATSF